jgi:hypothetical protein
MSNQTIQNRFYVQTDPANDTWLDITLDVLLRGSTWTKGMGAGPNDRTASPGQASLLLRNDSEHGSDHRYTPGHINCMPGFDVKCKIMIRSFWEGIEKTQWVGWIPPKGIIQPQNSLRAQVVQVVAWDWMYFALNNPVTLQMVDDLQDFGQYGSSLAAQLEAQPSRIDLSDYAEIFNTVYDAVRENTTVFAEIDKGAKTELGFGYIKYDPGTAKDILYFEGREARAETELYDSYPSLGLWYSEDGRQIVTEKDSAVIFAEVATSFSYLPDVISFMHSRGPYFTNRVLGKTYPRKIGAPLTALFSLDKPFLLKANQSIDNLRIRYVNTSSNFGNLSAKDCSITDYHMNSQEDNLGTDLTASLLIVPTFGSADSSLAVENTGGVDGWVQVIEISGTPIYIANTITQVIDMPSENSEYYSKIELVIDQAYQVDPLKTLDQISVIAARYNERRNEIDEILVCSNKSEAVAGLYMLTDIGGLIPLSYPAAGINENYFIQQIQTYMKGTATFCKIKVKPASYDLYQYWMLGVPGRSELNTTAILGTST